MSRLAPAATAADLQLDGTNLTLVIVVAVIAVISLVMGVFFRQQVLAADPGTEKMQEIGAAVEEGAQAYLARQFKTLSVFVVLVFGLLLLLPADTAGVRWGRSGFFVVGALFSAAIGYLGMSLAVKANVRVASAARGGDRDSGMKIAFRTGGTVGMATVGLGLLGASVVVLLYKGDSGRVVLELETSGIDDSLLVSGVELELIERGALHREQPPVRIVGRMGAGENIERLLEIAVVGKRPAITGEQWLVAGMGDGGLFKHGGGLLLWHFVRFRK